MLYFFNYYITRKYLLYYSLHSIHAAFACGQQEGKIMEEPYFKSDQAPLFDIEEEIRLAFDHTNFQESDNKAISNKMKSMGLNRLVVNRLFFHINSRMI